MQELTMRNYAYLGDAVWELFVREQTAFITSNTKLLHSMTTERVKTEFQMMLLSKISDYLTEEECELVRRARNTSIPVARRSMQQKYRQATAFEALIGFWYLNDKDRLDYFFKYFLKLEEFIL